ncbi:OmpH family outer membrane protein [Rickettsiales bacterium]|nr:OmpH family outer membrane protein [Rickettsiales bacterium]
MKKIFLNILSITLIFLCFNIDKALSQNIAVVDVDEILKNSLAMNNIESQMSKKESYFQKDIDKNKMILEKRASNIESKKAVMSESALKKEGQKIMQELNNLQKEAVKKQKLLKKGYVESLAKIDQKIKKILDDISNEKNIDIILPSSALASYKDHLDISAEVLKRLNKELKTVKVNFER